MSGITTKEFWFSTPDNVQKICLGNNVANFDFNLQTISNFSGVNNLTTLGLPASVNAIFSANNITTNGSFSLSINNLSTLSPGRYPFIVKGQSGNNIYQINLEIIILSQNFQL